jgi:hypothetical protein
VPIRAPVPGNANVHLTDYTDNDGDISSVILSGTVGDYGSAIRDDSDSQRVGHRRVLDDHWRV